MAKNMLVRCGKEIGKEVERMGFGKVGNNQLGERFSIIEKFGSSRINADQMRVYYAKIGDKQLIDAVEKTISFFKLQEVYNKPEKTYWRADYNKEADNIHFLMSWEEYSDDPRDEECLREFCNQLEVMGSYDKVQEIKLEAVFSPENSFEKMPGILMEMYEKSKESIEIVQADLHTRISHTIKKEKKKYAITNA